MAGMMALCDGDAQMLEARRGGILVQIATTHGQPQPQTQLCDAAHTGAADADKMEPAPAMQDAERCRRTHRAGSFLSCTLQDLALTGADCIRSRQLSSLGSLNFT